MKKFLFIAAALLMFAVPAANAQKVNTANELKKLEKVDVAIADAKKNVKAATWIAHGKAYIDAYYDTSSGTGHNIDNLRFNI